MSHCLPIEFPMLACCGPVFPVEFTKESHCGISLVRRQQYNIDHHVRSLNTQHTMSCGNVGHKQKYNDKADA